MLPDVSGFAVLLHNHALVNNIVTGVVILYNSENSFEATYYKKSNQLYCCLSGFVTYNATCTE